MNGLPLQEPHLPLIWAHFMPWRWYGWPLMQVRLLVETHRGAGGQYRMGSITVSRAEYFFSYLSPLSGYRSSGCSLLGGLEGGHEP